MPPEISLFTRRDALLLTAGAVAVLATETPAAPLTPIQIPEWVHGVTRMTFCSPGEVAKAARAGAQVIHTNVVWPYWSNRAELTDYAESVLLCRSQGGEPCPGIFVTACDWTRPSVRD